MARRAPQAVARAGRLLRGGPRPRGGPATGARDLDARLPARVDPDRQARRALRRRPPGDAPSDRGRGAGNLRLGRHRDGRREPAGRTHPCWVADDQRVGHRNADHRDRRLRTPRGGEGGVARHHSARAGSAGRRRGPRPRDAAQDHAVQRPSHGSARPRARPARDRSCRAGERAHRGGRDRGDRRPLPPPRGQAQPRLSIAWSGDPARHLSPGGAARLRVCDHRRLPLHPDAEAGPGPPGRNTAGNRGRAAVPADLPGDLAGGPRSRLLRPDEGGPARGTVQVDQVPDHARRRRPLTRGSARSAPRADVQVPGGPQGHPGWTGPPAPQPG